MAVVEFLVPPDHKDAADDVVEGGLGGEGGLQRAARTMIRII